MIAIVLSFLRALFAAEPLPRLGESPRARAVRQALDEATDRYPGAAGTPLHVHVHLDPVDFAALAKERGTHDALSRAVRARRARRGAAGPVTVVLAEASPGVRVAPYQPWVQVLPVVGAPAGVAAATVFRKG